MEFIFTYVLFYLGNYIAVWIGKSTIDDLLDIPETLLPADALLNMTAGGGYGRFKHAFGKSSELSSFLIAAGD